MKLGCKQTKVNDSCSKNQKDIIRVILNAFRINIIASPSQISQKIKLPLILIRELN